MWTAFLWFHLFKAAHLLSFFNNCYDKFIADVSGNILDRVNWRRFNNDAVKQYAQGAVYSIVIQYSIHHLACQHESFGTLKPCICRELQPLLLRLQFAMVHRCWLLDLPNFNDSIHHAIHKFTLHCLVALLSYGLRYKLYFRQILDEVDIDE